MLDIDQIRRDTPACESLLHFNNAGCALSPASVTAAVTSHLAREQALGGYEAAVVAAQQVENFYHAVATLLGCAPAEVAYMENATRAWELALHSIPFAAGDQIITGEMEYGSNYLGLLHLAKRQQLEIVVVGSDSRGLIDVADLRARINPRSKLIALTHVASHRGDVQPAVEVGRIAREHGLLYLLDACQSAGQLPLDVATLGCDFLCGTGRKYLRGPRGTGFLYVRRERLADTTPIFIDLQAASWDSPSDYVLRDDARRFESFERFIAGQIGLGVAIDYANALGSAAIAERVAMLADLLADRLEDYPDITVMEQAPQRSGIITFTKRRESAADLQRRLHGAQINTSIARLANARLEHRDGAGEDRVRASVHYYNTETEIAAFIAAVTAK